MNARAMLTTALCLTLTPLATRGATPLTTEQVASGLDNPIFVTHAPNDFARVFIIEQPGVIRILNIASDPPTLLATPFLDIDARVDDTKTEQGLLGLAFHPQFASNGYFYVSYTDAADDVHISRFHVPAATPNEADDTSELNLLTTTQPQTNHNGGWLAFSPNDGYLYIATGDGGGSGDDDTGHNANRGNAQDKTDNLLGKLLRIDVDTSDGPGGNYGIPPTNPYIGTNRSLEIWSFGLRNPWRNSFDPVTGDLYIADVGQGAWEEINLQAGSSGGGENWGWRCREGAHDFNTTGGGCSGALLDPLQEYAHGGTPFRCSVTGGEVYRGCAVPDLSGAYFYADWCSDEIWSFVASSGAVTELTDRTAELDPGGGLTIETIGSFGRDAYGEIYIADRGGEIFRIVPDGIASQCSEPIPATSASGRFALVSSLLAAAIGLAALRARR